MHIHILLTAAIYLHFRAVEREHVHIIVECGHNHIVQEVFYIFVRNRGSWVWRDGPARMFHL